MDWFDITPFTLFGETQRYEETEHDYAPPSNLMLGTCVPLVRGQNLYL
jgi:hypothetical protein